MPEPIKYICSCCGQEHEEWPALAFTAPDNYDHLSDEEKEQLGELRFIRVTLTQKVTDHCENLEYGLWVSLSEKSFRDYKDNFNNEYHETGYFGWLSNKLPDYTFDKSIPMNVFVRPGNQRPEVAPHTDFDHFFCA